MSVAELRIVEDDRRYGDMPGRRIEIDCPHAMTGVSIVGARTLTDVDAVRIALLRHHDEEHCRCTRALWQEYFGCPWPQVKVA